MNGNRGRLGRTVVICLAMAMVGGAAGAGEVRDGWEVLKKPGEAFSLADLAGGTLKSSSLRGRIVVVDFWTTWCAPCIKELPDLQAWHERLKGRKDVTFLSMNATEEKDVVQSFVKAKRLGMPVYLADPLVDPYEVSIFPTKLVIDMRAGVGKPGAGLIRFRKEGTATVASIEARVAELLAETN